MVGRSVNKLLSLFQVAFLKALHQMYAIDACIVTMKVPRCAQPIYLTALISTLLVDAFLVASVQPSIMALVLEILPLSFVLNKLKALASNAFLIIVIVAFVKHVYLLLRTVLHIVPMEFVFNALKTSILSMEFAFHCLLVMSQVLLELVDQVTIKAVKIVTEMQLILDYTPRQQPLQLLQPLQHTFKGQQPSLLPILQALPLLPMLLKPKLIHSLSSALSLTPSKAHSQTMPASFSTIEAK